MLFLAHTGITLGAAAILAGIATSRPARRSSQSIAPRLGYPLRITSQGLTALGKLIDTRLLMMLELIRKDGSHIWTEINTTPIKQQGKSVVIGFVRDITERKQAEETLRELEAKFKGLVTNVKLGIFRSTLGRTGKFLEVNPAMEEITGYSREELLKMNVSDLYVHPEKREAVLGKVVSATGKVTNELHLRKKDGTEIVISDTKVAVKDDKGKVIFFDGIIEDITERKRMEETLKKTQDNLLKAQEIAKLGNWSWQRDTDIDFWSEEIYRMLVYTPGKIQPTFEWLSGITHPDDREQVAKNIEESMRTGKSYAGVYRLTRKGGSEITVESRAEVVLNQTGEATGMVGVIQDITERRRAEEREKQLQAEISHSSRLAAIGELAAGVAHEINNPLTGIVGFSELFLKKSTDREASRRLERIHSEAKRAARIVQNLLTFARRREPKREYADINDILQRALELRAYELKTGNIKVTVELASGLPQVAVGPPQIQEVFLNIILNAEHAMIEANGGGKLSIQTQRIDSFIRVSFADDGPGVPAGQLGTLFDPFFTTRGDKGGTGLGLSICHGIVTEHGGRIYARSQPGRGATFFVELPV